MPPRNAIATSGDIRYVNGRHNAIALTNEMPGNAPATTPMSRPRNSTARLSGCRATAMPPRTLENASIVCVPRLEPALINSQQLVERDCQAVEDPDSTVERQCGQLDERIKQHHGSDESDGDHHVRPSHA